MESNVNLAVKCVALLLFFAVPRVHAVSTNQLGCKCENERNWLFTTILPWLLLGFVCLLFYAYIKNDGKSTPKSASSLAKARLGRTVHMLDTNNNLALAKLEQNLPIKSAHFRGLMQLVTEFAIQYLGDPEAYAVTSDVKPGFLYKKLPKEMPWDQEQFSLILDDIYAFIMPGLTHWQHPRFHGYFPAGCSYPDILAEALISALSVIQFSWDSSPAFTELEVAMINWLGRAIGLKESFLFVGNAEQSKGGGALQSSASDAVLIALLAARHKKICELVPRSDPNYRGKQAGVLGKLVAYASAEAHTCIEKACELAMVRLRPIPVDEKYSMRGKALEHEIKKDFERGYLPFFVLATSGTTSLCSFDDVAEVVAVAKKYSMWTHVDAAYAGGAMICPEFRYNWQGIDEVDSINVNMHKLLLVSTTCTVLWTKDQVSIRAAYEIDPTYLKKTNTEATDFRHWGISLSRRTKSLKLWLLFRMYGLKNLQNFIRRLVHLAHRFRRHLEKDSRIELVGDTFLSLVCFRVQDLDVERANRRTSDLCEFINRSHRILVTHASLKKRDIIRICICQERSNEEDIDESWRILKELMDVFFSDDGIEISAKRNRFNVDLPLQTSPCPTVDATVVSSLTDNVSSVGALSATRSPDPTSPGVLSSDGSSKLHRRRKG